MDKIEYFLKKFLLQLIRLYRIIFSPYVGQHCRFTPSCSTYAEEAIEKFGILQGSFVALKRLGRCHPWAPGGIDPVPQERHKNG